MRISCHTSAVKNTSSISVVAIVVVVVALVAAVHPRIERLEPKIENIVGISIGIVVDLLALQT